MNQPLKGYGAGIRKETLLGWVAWYGISDPSVEYDPLRAKVEELGLDVEAMPSPVRPGDAFKRACRYAQASKIPLGSDTYANVLIRKVHQDTDVLEWHMIVETVDPEGKRLSYDEAATLLFRKRTYEVQHTYKAKNNQMVTESNVFMAKGDAMMNRDELEEDDSFDEQEVKLIVNDTPQLSTERTAWSNDRPQRTIVDDAIAEFRQEFEHASKYLDAQTIRQMVRRQMDIMRSFLLRRNGSVYFIPKDEEPKAVALTELLEWIGNGSGFHILPLIDTDKQRELIQGAFEDEVHESAQTMLNALSEALHAGEKITFSKWNAYLEEKDKLLARAREYSDLIDREFAKAGTELALLDDTMTELLKKDLIKAERGS